MRYKRRRAPACSGSDGEDEILPSQHRKRAIDAMEGRLANLAGEVSALRSQLEDLRKLHGELAAEGDMLHARLLSLPEDVKVNRSSDARALGSGSTRGSDPGSTIHFSMFTAAEPSSPGGHASIDRRYPQSKSRTNAPDSRSADDHVEHLARGPTLALDPWDEIMMSTYHGDGPEFDGPQHLAAGSTTGSPATGLNATLNTSTPRLTGSGAVSIVHPSVPGGGGGGGGDPALAAPLNVDAAGQLEYSSPAAAAAAAGGTSAGPSGEPNGGHNSGSGEEQGPSAVPAGMDNLCWQQQQQQLSEFTLPCNLENSFPNPLEHQHQLPLHSLQPPTQQQQQLQAGQRQHPCTAAALRQPTVTGSLSPRGISTSQPRQSLQLTWQQQQQTGSPQELEDPVAGRSRGHRAHWPSTPPHLGGGANAALLGLDGGGAAGAAATDTLAEAAAGGTVGPAGDTGSGTWLASGQIDTGEAVQQSPLPPTLLAAVTATAAGPLGTSPSVTLAGNNARDGGGGGGSCIYPLLRSEHRGLSVASRLSGGVVRGGVTRTGKSYPSGGGPAAAAAALLHDAGMSPVCCLGALGSLGTMASMDLGGDAAIGGGTIGSTVAMTARAGRAAGTGSAGAGVLPGASSSPSPSPLPFIFRAASASTESVIAALQQEQQQQQQSFCKLESQGGGPTGLHDAVETGPLAGVGVGGCWGGQQLQQHLKDDPRADPGEGGGGGEQQEHYQRQQMQLASTMWPGGRGDGGGIDKLGGGDGVSQVDCLRPTAGTGCPPMANMAVTAVAVQQQLAVEQQQQGGRLVSAVHSFAPLPLRLTKVLGCGEMAGDGVETYQKQQELCHANSSSPVNGTRSGSAGGAAPSPSPATPPAAAAAVPGAPAISGVPGLYCHPHLYNPPYGQLPPQPYVMPYTSPYPLPMRYGSGPALDRSLVWRRAPGVRHPAHSAISPPPGTAFAGGISTPPPGPVPEPGAPN